MYGLVPALAGGDVERSPRLRQIRPDTGSGSDRSMDPRCLIDAVEFDVIPRLLDAHRGGNMWGGMTSLAADAVPVAPSVAPLADHLLAQRMDDANTLVDGLRARGVTIEVLYTGLLSEAARYMGLQWEDDRASFADVTVGLCGLHQIMYRLSPGFRDERPAGPVTGTALLVPAPQETHFFGVLMAADFFARAGWQVWAEVDCTAERLVSLIREEEFELIGFSISCDKYVERTGAMIETLRTSLKRPLSIMIGGRAASDGSDAVRRIGADAVARDAQEGIRLAGAMLDKAGSKTGNSGAVNFHSQK